MTEWMHQLARFVLITLMINAAGWTFNQEAVFDVFTEPPEASASFAQSSSGPAGHLVVISGTESQSFDTCNHWCHAIGHFVGFFPTPLAIAGNSHSEHFVAVSPPRFPSSQTPLFRPPRLPA